MHSMPLGTVIAQNEFDPNAENNRKTRKQMIATLLNSSHDDYHNVVCRRIDIYNGYHPMKVIRVSHLLPLDRWFG